MAKRHKPEEVIAKLRQVEVMTSEGTSMVDAIRSIGVTEVTYYLYGRLSHCKSTLSRSAAGPVANTYPASPENGAPK